MIHVVPCSCELHVRIRELEAELAEPTGVSKAAWKHRVRQIDADRLAWRKAAFEAVARAEKAEAELARRLNDAMNWKARAEKAEMLAQRYSDELDAKCEEVRELHARHGECQARVAELEAANVEYQIRINRMSL